MKKIEIPSVSLPKGGGAVSSIGETFQPDDFTGSAGLLIPIHTSPCRGFEPELSLNYSSGSGNGIFGIGFDLAIPSIVRKTEKGFPKYDDTDTFLISNADDLVPQLTKEVDSSWKRRERSTASVNGKSYAITRYRPRTEGLFARIEKWANTDESARGDVHWRVTTKDNVTSLYGRTQASRIADPNDEARIFQWLLDETHDARGNHIRYTYESDRSWAPPSRVGATGNGLPTAKYIHSIKYGRHIDKNDQENWHFEVIFDYGERLGDGPEQLTYATERDWQARTDPFSSYRAGFEIRTQRLCRRILMFHRFADDEPFLVSGTHLKYKETPCLSLLSEVTQVGYRKADEGGIESKAMPPLVLRYSESSPATEFLPLTRGSADGRNGTLRQRIDEFVDLYGDGLPGLLVSDDHATLYSRPLGDGHYDAPSSPAHLPISRSLLDGQYALADLGGDGKLDLVVHKPSGSGFFQSNAKDQSWAPYRPFQAYPTEAFNKSRQMADVTGDGLADLVMFQSKTVRVYPSRGKEGFGPATEQKRAHDLPLTRQSSAVEYIGFADLIGDGGNHLVRIRSGSVECWPHLGHGRFGEKLVLGNPPDFGGELDPARLFLADIDGSGTADLLYACHDRLEVYRNQSGNGFANKEQPPLVLEYDRLDRIRFADILGNGTSCLVLTSREADMGLRHEYFDFSGGAKPHMLIGIKNNMGAEKIIRYAPSTKFYLDDMKAKKPWATRLPFPVQVVDSVEVIDHVAGSRLVTRYAYHDGYYDPLEREFRGFGYVEQWDCKGFDDHKNWIAERKKNGPFEGSVGMDEDPVSHVAPLYKRSWFHGGTEVERGRFSDHYRKRNDTERRASLDHYYQEDPKSNRDRLPDSAPDDATFPKELDPATRREAYRALHGHKLREEIYGLDRKQNPDLADHPFLVTEYSYKIRLVQPMEDQKHAVCFVHPSEKISWHYERNPNDPRIAHEFTVEVDEHGQPVKSVQVHYPRRHGVAAYPEQRPSQLDARATVESFINTDHSDGSGNNHYLIGVPKEEKTFEIGGLQSDGQHLLQMSDIADHLKLALANEVSFESEAKGTPTQARLLSWVRHFYWDQALEEALPLGAVAAHELHHHSESAVFSTKGVQETYGDRVTDKLLRDDAKYTKMGGYWWKSGLTQHYQRKEGQLYLPTNTTDRFGAKTIVSYDDFNLVQVKITDALGHETSVQIDYHTLQPFRIRDANDNVTEVFFDPLGIVIATSIYGREGDKDKGDAPLRQASGASATGRNLRPFDRSGGKFRIVQDAQLSEILKDPEDYLQQATSFFHYEHGLVDGQPPHAVTLLRETHVSDLQADKRSRIQVHVAYSDGFGRPLQSMVNADSNDDSGNRVERWLTSGRILYNNKGKPAKQYEPSYTPTARYNPSTHGVTQVTHYDPLLRVVRVTNPEGFFSKVKITPWEETHYDENDTFKDSQYYREKGGKVGSEPAARDRLEALAKHCDTPQTLVFDNQGRVCQIIEQLEAAKDLAKLDAGLKLVTRHVLDIEGNELSSIDPLGRCCFKNSYDMEGAVLSARSADAGERLMLRNAAGNPIRTWDDRRFQTTLRYDALHRPTEIQVRGGDSKRHALDQVVERMIYGDGTAESKKSNLCGRLIRHYDNAGLVTFDAYDIKGELIESTRRLRNSYDREASWHEGHEAQALEDEDAKLETRWAHDALGRVTRETLPDGSVTTHFYHLEGTLKQLLLTPPASGEGGQIPLVKEIAYNARGQREKIDYGNGVTTRYGYCNETFRLISLRTTGEGDGATWQDIHYSYDPVGNIKGVCDNAPQSAYFQGDAARATYSYRYDAIYQLVETAGRAYGSAAGTPQRGWSDEARIKQPQPGDGPEMQAYTEAYEFDAAGNIAGLAHSSSTGSWLRRFAYKEASRIDPAETCNRLSATSDWIDEPESSTFSYDGHGNMTSMPHLSAMEWNCHDQLKRSVRGCADSEPTEGHSSNPPGMLPESTWYTYDAKGQRVRQVTGSYAPDGRTPVRKSERVYFGSYEVHRVYERDDSQPKCETETLHVLDGRQRIALVESQTKPMAPKSRPLIRYQFDDHLDPFDLELDEEARLISYEEYLAFGGTAYQSVSDGPNTAKRYRYSGKERDVSTGLYYFGARFYAPWLGRWVSPDPAGASDGLNIYAFVQGNPTTHLDEWGTVKGPKQASDRTLRHSTWEKTKKALEKAHGPGSRQTQTWNSRYVVAHDHQNRVASVSELMKEKAETHPGGHAAVAQENQNWNRTVVESGGGARRAADHVPTDHAQRGPSVARNSPENRAESEERPSIGAPDYLHRAHPTSRFGHKPGSLADKERKALLGHGSTAGAREPTHYELQRGLADAIGMHMDAYYDMKRWPKMSVAHRREVRRTFRASLDQPALTRTDAGVSYGPVRVRRNDSRRLLARLDRSFPY